MSLKHYYPALSKLAAQIVQRRYQPQITSHTAELRKLIWTMIREGTPAETIRKALAGGDYSLLKEK
jgi:hypothetical protein